jgi:hypothetical protein
LLTYYKKFTLPIPSDYGRIGGAPLDDGGFIVLAQESIDYEHCNWYFEQLDDILIGGYQIR